MPRGMCVLIVSVIASVVLHRGAFADYAEDIRSSTDCAKAADAMCTKGLEEIRVASDHDLTDENVSEMSLMSAMMEIICFCLAFALVRTFSKRPRPKKSTNAAKKVAELEGPWTPVREDDQPESEVQGANRRRRPNDGQAGQPNESLRRCLIDRCADGDGLRQAEWAATFLRSRGEMNLSCYKALMKAYANSGQHDQACDLYQEMKDAGLQPDSVMCSSFLKLAVKAGRAELSQEVAGKIGGGGNSVKNYMWLIRSAGQEGNADKVLSIFRKFKKLQPDLVDVMAYNITLDTLVACRDAVRTEELLEEMGETHELNLVTYNTMIKGYCMAGDFAKARKIINRMSDNGVEPDVASFSCLLCCATKALDFRGSKKIIEEMDRRNLPMDPYTTSIMMQLSRKLTNPWEASQALAILDRPDVKIFGDEVVFNTVLDACIYRRDHRRLTVAVDGYPGSNIIPTMRTYGLLIKACAVLRRTKASWEFWNELVAHPTLEPNDVTLGCMIDALVEAQRVEDALTLFQEWKTKVPCDTIVYSTLIKGFASTGDADRAMALYGDMRSNGIQMNHIVFTTLINAHSKNGLMKRAEQLLKEMEADGCKPNAITYSSLIRGHCLRGDMTASLNIFQQMLRTGFQADSVIFNTLLDGCVRHCKFALADELFMEMKHHNVPASNYTLSIIVKMWSKRKQLDKAFDAVYSALRDTEGPFVDAQVGACIVGACIHNNSPHRALEVFEEMKTWPNFEGPDANTYSALISGIPRHGYLRRAVELAIEACDYLKAKPGYDIRQLAPNALWQLFRALKSERLLNELGRPLAEKLRESGMHVDKQWLMI